MLSQDPRRRFNRNRPGHVWRSHERKRHFGIVSAPLIAGLVDAGLSAGVADVAGTALVGAGLGAGTSALTGGNIGFGALTGGLTGGALGGLGGAGGIVDSATGLGAVGSDVLIGAGAGALGNAITGQNVGTGALGGAVSGGIAGLSATTPSGAAAGSPTAGGASAIGSAAPPGAGSIDLTAADFATSPSAGSFSNVSASGVNQALGNGTGATSALGLAPSALSDPAPGFYGGGVSGANAPSALSDPLPGYYGGTGAGGAASPSALSPPAAGTYGAGAGAAGATGANAPFNYDNSTTGGILNSLGVTTPGQDPGAFATGIAKNPGALVGAAGLGYNLLKGNSVPDQSKLEGQAQQLSTQGKELASYLQSGQLPAGAQAALSQATNAAKASVRSNFASQGLSGSQQEAQALQQIDLNAAQQQFSIADKLLTQGLDETKLSSSIYSDLLKVNQEQTKDTGSAIANFAASLGGFQTPKVAGG